MKIRLASILFLIILVHAACEEVIDIDLKEVEKSIVVEANITNEFGRKIIKLSRTAAFGDTTFDPVTGAKVYITAPGGFRANFTEQQVVGMYRSVPFQGIPGSRYTLHVETLDKTYTAVSTMPEPVQLDSISLSDVSFFGSDSHAIPKVYYRDPEGVANQYRFVVYVNSKKRGEFYVANDRFNDGKQVDLDLYSEEELLPLDTLQVEMHSIDLPVYKYFFAFNQLSGEGGPPVTPANPQSNLTNGALGYFSAHPVSRKSIVIK